MKRKYEMIIKNVLEEEVYAEIQKAIEVGLDNCTPAAKAFWERVSPNGTPPTPEKLIELIIMAIHENEYGDKN